MPDFTPVSIELKTVVAKAAKCGIPSSDDYNAFQEGVLNDLSDITAFLNEQLMPVLSSLPARAAEGLDGASLYADRQADSPLFRDAEGSLFTVGDVLTSLSNLQTALARKVEELNTRVVFLQTRLATTDQNDLRSSLQGVQDTVRVLTTTLSAMAGDVSTAGLGLGKLRSQTVTLDAASAGAHDLDVVFSPVMPSNDYAVSLSVVGTELITVQKVVKKADGAGLTVTLTYAAGDPTGTLDVLVRAY